MRFRVYTVAFDLDDTLYDRTQPFKKTLLEFNATSSLSFDPFNKIFQHNSDIGFDHVKNHIWTLEESHIFRIKESLQQLGIHITKSDAQVFQKLYEKNQQHIELYPMIVEILNYLREKEVQTLIITNGPSSHQRNKIRNLGLDRYFNPNQIIVSEEEDIAKPDIRIFELAESRFAMDKANTWFIGDSYAFDIVGASNAGWQTIWLNSNKTKKNPVNLPTKTVSSTLELIDYLFHIFE